MSSSTIDPSQGALVSHAGTTAFIYSPTFTLTPALRWKERYDGDTTIKVLQQAWQGSDGTVKWEDVPTEP